MSLPYVLHRYQQQENQKVASNVTAKQVVRIVGTSVPLVVPVGTVNVEPDGLVDANASVGDQVVIYKDTNVVKGIAAASVGVGVPVGVASANGALGPIAAASGVLIWQTGESKTPAAAGETFSVEVKIRQLSGAA